MRGGITLVRNRLGSMIFTAAFGITLFLLPAAGLCQIAGPGSDSPENLPGWSAKPTERPRIPEELSDPQVIALIHRMAAAGVLHPRTLTQWREAYSFYTMFEGTPEAVFQIEDRTIPGPAEDIPIRVYRPTGAAGLPVWVFFHGGGFVAGSLDSHDTPLRAIANRCACIVVSVAYRLAPEHSYPAATDDAYAATKWVADHAAEIGGDPNRVAVGGDGAGGNLAAVVALMARDRGGPRLACQLLIYPTLDLTMLTTSWIVGDDPILTTDAMLAVEGTYVPVNTDTENPYISPVYAKNLENLPSAFVITDADDPVRDEAETYATRLGQAGVEATISRYPNMIHGFFLMSGALDAGKQSIDEVAAMLKKVFADSETSSQTGQP